MRKYDEEFKREAVRKVFDGQTVASVSRELGVSENQIHNWKKRIKDANTPVENEVIVLKKKLREVVMERDILKKSGAYLRQGRVERYGLISREKVFYPVRLLCRAMKVSRAGYYAFAGGKSYLKGREKTRLAERVKEVFWFHGRRYGSRRVSDELKDDGERAGRHRVRRLMREQNLWAIQPRRFRPRTTVSDNTKASPNLLREVSASRPKTVLVGDITYLPLANGKWCYLASWQDKVSKRVAGWKLSDRMTDDLVIGALGKALMRGLVAKDAIIHSDRGSQYSSNNFRKLLSENGLRQSMCGRGNCYDNAQAESFWARFKTELLDGGLFESVAQARSETFSYIDGYYNRIRKHSSLGYKSPEQFERQFDNLKMQAAA